MTESAFTQLGVARPIVDALASEGYAEPTPIQRRPFRPCSPAATFSASPRPAPARPRLSRCRSCSGFAKNAGRSEPRRPRALVLAPTRELAGQIGEQLRRLRRNLRLRHTVIFGGVGQNPQVSALGTRRPISSSPRPGGLLDLIGQGHVRLDRVSDPGPRRGRPHARHGLRARHAEDRRACCRRSGSHCCSRRPCRSDVAEIAAEFLRDPAGGAGQPQGDHGRARQPAT